MSAVWPPTQSLMEVQTTTRCLIMRRVRTGVSTLQTPTFEWQRAAVIWGGIQPISGVLRMTMVGMTALSTHRFITQFRRESDGGFVVRPNDIVVDSRTSDAYLVKFVADEGGAHWFLTADLEHGTLNKLQSLAEQNQ